MDVDYTQHRVRMVDGQVRTTDVTSAALLDAMLEVPREEFVDASRRPLAYIDEDLPIAGGSGRVSRYVMEPSPFAKLVQLADIAPNDLILDVGCGTGYSSAVLSRLGGSVVALESDAALAAKATETLARLGYDNVAVVGGDLTDGYRAEAPYDVIFINGSVDYVPDALLDQLREGGRLVAIEGRGNAGKAKRYLKADGTIAGRSAFNAAVKPLPGFEKKQEFQF
jgi:protein-L-isoaspartate(D-aspartate) O-methyltransferase